MVFYFTSNGNNFEKMTGKIDFFQFLSLLI